MRKKTFQMFGHPKKVGGGEALETCHGYNKATGITMIRSRTLLLLDHYINQEAFKYGITGFFFGPDNNEVVG